MPKKTSPIFSSSPEVCFGGTGGADQMKKLEVALTGRRPVDHYMAGKWEVIDVIEGMMPKGLTPYQGFLWGNAIKYMMRFMYKGTPVACLHKAETYIAWLRNSLEEQKSAKQ
jgi:hypothetical protein